MHFLPIAFVSALFVCGCATHTTPKPMDNYIAIFPGEKIFVEVAIQNNSAQFKKVGVVTHPDITLTFELTATNAGVVLAAKNPLTQSFKYHLNRMDFKGKLHPTSSCPLITHLGAFETWPHPIPELRISEPRIINENESDLCIY